MSRRALRTGLLAAAAAALVAAAGISAAGPATAESPDVVISQVYGGGGNSGATYTNDFIELANRGDGSVDLAGWSVQYASASGTSWQATPLTGTIAPGGRYLVQQARGAGGSAALPGPDATGTISMSATAGKVALLNTGTRLTCTAGCATAPGVRDFVGYGAANDAEGSPAPAPSNTNAVHRADNGRQDSDDNAADFTAAPAKPRDGSGPSPTTPPTDARIHDIQGAAHVSPLDGAAVAGVPGVVTAVTGNGFWMQDSQPDADPATSDAIFVFTASAPTVARGDAVQVSGTVSEFRPGGSGGSTNLSTTQIKTPTVTVTGRGEPAPAATVVGPGGRVAPTPVRTDEPGDVEKSATFDPAKNALDFYESLEGMLVRVVDAVATGPTSGFGEVSVLPGGEGTPRTVRGGVRYTYPDANAERVVLDDVLAKTPVVNTGDRFPGPVDGVLDYSFGNFKLLVLATPQVTAGDLPRETTRQQGIDELAVATYNVENLDPTDPQAKFDRLALGVVDHLRAPDIIALEEVQDNNGATDDGVVAADQTYRKLIAAITAAGGPAYDFRQVDPEHKADGGEPGGNIRVGFLFRTDRGVAFVDKPGGDATTATRAVRDGRSAGLTLSPGRVDPTNSAFEDSRKPLAGQFKFKGNPVIVVANHFSSKGGDQPLFGRFQPPTRSSEAQRHAQATAVRDFVSAVRAVDADANVVVLGDVNDFEFSRTTDLLVGDGWLTDLPRVAPEAERYSYVFDGNSQVLDHILVSAPLVKRGYEYDVVHINAEYADQASDHDPQVVRLKLGPGVGQRP